MFIDCPLYGRAFEKDFLGIHFDEVPEELRNLRSHCFRRAIEIAMCNQDKLQWDPRNPRTRLSRCFYERVKMGLGDEDDLQMVISIGTPLDRMGVDFFLCLNERKIVTFDLTVNPGKKKKDATDYLLTRQGLVRGEHYALARRVAEDLLRCRHW